jgi:hypothetical protein
MPYKAKGKCVYKADTGKKVGCTKGPVKKYLAALHANVPDAKHESKKLNTMNKSKTTSNIFNPNIVKRIADQVVELQKDTLHEPVWNIDEFMFRNMVMRYVDPAIEKMWLKMNDAQQEQLQQAVERYLGKTDADYRNPKYHEVNETKNTTMKKSELKQLIREVIEEAIQQGGFVSPETHADMAALRRREKGDDDGPDLARSMVGVTFFNVPTGKEEIARKIGLKQFKSGKWGHKHVTYTQTTIDVEKLKAAEKEFGKGRYWQPKN